MIRKANASDKSSTRYLILIFPSPYFCNRHNIQQTTHLPKYREDHLYGSIQHQKGICHLLLCTAKNQNRLKNILCHVQSSNRKCCLKQLTLLCKTKPGMSVLKNFFFCAWDSKNFRGFHPISVDKSFGLEMFKSFSVTQLVHLHKESFTSLLTCAQYSCHTLSSRFINSSEARGTTVCRT